jgi:hypothetical protein
VEQERAAVRAEERKQMTRPIVHADTRRDDLGSALAQLPEAPARVRTESDSFRAALASLRATPPRHWGEVVVRVLAELGENGDGRRTFWHRVRLMRGRDRAAWINAIELCADPLRDAWDPALDEYRPDLDVGSDWREELVHPHRPAEARVLRRERARIAEIRRELGGAP